MLRLQIEKPNNFDKNSSRGTLFKKVKAKTAENKNRENSTDQMFMALGLLTSSFSVERDFTLGWYEKLQTFYMKILHGNMFCIHHL